jgi:hypothetical protein
MRDRPVDRDNQVQGLYRANQDLTAELTGCKNELNQANKKIRADKNNFFLNLLTIVCVLILANALFFKSGYVCRTPIS